MSFDGVKYWDNEVDTPYELFYETNPLPSDSLYRKDLLYLKM
jgi:hypothetical protein